MNEKMFQIIFDKLQESIPVTWNEIVFYVGYSKDSYSMKYYVNNGNGQYIDCFSIEDNSPKQLMKLFVSINNEIDIVRNRLDDSERWNVLTMIIDSNGDFRTDFEYTDIGENSISYERKWKNRYLK